MTGIYCIEADWDGPYSVEQPLRFLTEAHKAGYEFHGRVRSSTQFGKALRGWVERTDWDYALLYLGFHGFERGVQVGRGSAPLRDYVRLEQIADLVAHHGHDVLMKGCLIHFGACSTMDVGDSEIADFLEATQVEAISGYAQDVGWMASLAFDLVYLDALLARLKRNADTGEGVPAETASRCRDHLIHYCETKGFAESLGFRMVTKDDFGLDFD